MAVAAYSFLVSLWPHKWLLNTKFCDVLALFVSLY